MGVISSYP